MDSCQKSLARTMIIININMINIPPYQLYPSPDRFFIMSRGHTASAHFILSHMLAVDKDNLDHVGK